MMTRSETLTDTINNNYASAEEIERWSREGFSDKELARPAMGGYVIIDLDSINALPMDIED